jgi:hypothetical protein
MKCDKCGTELDAEGVCMNRPCVLGEAIAAMCSCENCKKLMAEIANLQSSIASVEARETQAQADRAAMIVQRNRFAADLGIANRELGLRWPVVEAAKMLDNATTGREKAAARANLAMVLAAYRKAKEAANG